MAALNPQRARILMGGLIAAGLIFTVLVLALDEDGPRGFPAGVRLPAETAEGASWSPDGRWVAIPNRDGVLLRGAKSEATVQLQAPRTPRYLGAIPGRISWSRDGTRLRYVTTVGPEQGPGAWATSVPIRDGGVQQVALGRNAVSADWARHGRWLVFASGGSAAEQEGDVPAPSALWELRGEEREPRKLLQLHGTVSDPKIAPDDTRIVFAYTPRRRHFFELWDVEPDGSRPRHLAGPFLTLAYSWSPDGKQLALVATMRNEDGRRHLYVTSSRGNTVRKLVDEELTDTAPAWTPGGRWITFATVDGEIEKVRPDGSERERIADFDGERVANLLWSPDGHQLAYSREAADEPD